MKVERADILVLFLIVVEMFWVSLHLVGRWLWVCCPLALLHCFYGPRISSFFRTFSWRHITLCWRPFVQISVRVISMLESYWFMYAKPSLRHLDEASLFMVDNPFECFWIRFASILLRITTSMFVVYDLLLWSSVWCWYQGNTGFI